MINPNDNLTKTKAFSLLSIMKNPKMFKMINEALAAPVGSTKRSQAKAAVSSLVKLGQNKFPSPMDGMGGGGLNVIDQPKTQQNLQVQPGDWSGLGSTTSLQGGSTADIQGAQVMPQGQDVNIQGSQLMPSLYQTGEQIPLGETEAPPKEDRTVVSGISDPTSITSTSGVPSFGQTYQEAYTKNWENLPEQYNTLIKALESGIGPEAFAQQIMSSKAELQKMFPGVPEEDLPVGASLARQTAALGERLKTEYTLDEQLTNVKALQRQGVTIQKDLEAYIRGRDEYLEEIDKMIDSTKDVMARIDMSNPSTAKMMNKYANYLYTIKGRQHKRYADFTQDAIDQYNDELKVATDNYNTAKAQFLEEYKIEVELTTDDYNRLKGMLTDMYNNLDTMSEKQWQKEKAYYDKEKARFSMMEEALDASDESKKVPYAQWAIEAGVAGRSESQVDDIMYSEQPPQWFIDEETKKRSQSIIGPTEPITEAEIMQLWKQQQSKLVDKSNKQANIQWARDFISRNFKQFVDVSSADFKKNLAKARNDIRASTSPSLTESEIDNVLIEFGFRKGYGGYWSPPRATMSKKETKNMEEIDKLQKELQKKIIDIQ